MVEQANKSEQEGGPAPTIDQHPAQPTNSMAVAALVLGILGWLTMIPAILAIIFGVLGWSRAKKIDGIGQGKAAWGLGLGIFWVVGGTLLFFTLGPINS